MDYEKLGVFYLGRRFDGALGSVTDEPILYDAKDLTTHAVCVGMTGSGKTGLGVALLEEAAIDGIPAIVIDPKGDLGNLLLTFPDLAAQDFLPWVDPAEAARKGRTPEEQARWTADLWRTGLAQWNESPERIARFAGSCERVIYTPGSQAGRPVTVLRSFAAPSPAVLADGEAMRERVQAATSGILALLGLAADPLRSREHILVSTLLDTAWRQGRSLDIATLIREIQNPPVQRVGVLDLESFYPANDRFELAMRLNNLLAAPGFAAWMEGETLDIGKLLYGEGGKPRLAIFSIAHLTDSERMFFVTILLNEILAWVRAQPGSSSLRALLYMDEIFGFFPPTANPPSKMPMLTLLKQARACGLGVVLATQNPVDLDYKGLANAGTWFLGRLQTERDKARVLEGLEGASAASGAAFDRGAMERTLAGLGNRVFLMNNVHDDAPVLFQTRWVLSYLAGPLTRPQIQSLGGAAEATSPAAPAPAAAATMATIPAPPAVSASTRPVLPPEVTERFVSARGAVEANATLSYRPALLGTGTLHYVNAKLGVDEWTKLTLLAPLADMDAVSPWEGAQSLASPPPLADRPDPGAAFAPLPAEAAQPRSYGKWESMLKTQLYQDRPLALWRCAPLKLVSQPGESESEFRARIRDAGRVSRDLAVAKLRAKLAPKLQRLQDGLARAQERVDRETSQLAHQRTQTAIAIGSTVLGALFGRKLQSTRTVSGASSSMRAASRARHEEGDVKLARDKLAALQRELIELEADCRRQLKAVRTGEDGPDLEADAVSVAPRKTDLTVDQLLLVWIPWRVGADGVAEPRF